ncbi:MAG: ATP-binding cassette domain-containing protein [Methanomassiliicoccaceae archaeon]|nr:ATP-binding cassette domain-containing protein [Methanomassiliicoccaceae archaeon]
MKTLEMHDVSVIKGGKKILDSITLSIEQNESVAIVGSNGSGKTTLIKLLRGELHPYYNEESPSIMKIFGDPNWNVFDVRSKMGVVSMDLQNQFASETLVSEVIASGFFGSIDVFRNMKVTEQMISKAYDSAVMMGIDDLFNRTLEGISLGEMRRALIARALVTDPSALVMDEPMTGLDIVMASKFRKMFDILIEAGVSLVVVTHNLEDIPDKIDRVIMMKNGKIFADGKKDKLLTSKIMSELYDESIKVECDNGTYHMHL